MDILYGEIPQQVLGAVISSLMISKFTYYKVLPILDYNILLTLHSLLLLGPTGHGFRGVLQFLFFYSCSESRKGNKRGGFCGRVWCLNKVELIFTVLIHSSGILTPKTPCLHPALLLLIPFCNHSVPFQYITHLRICQYLSHPDTPCLQNPDSSLA